MGMKYYHKQENRLVYVDEAATPEYWDKLWENHNRVNLHKVRYSKWNFVIRKSRQYLAHGAKIIEGGSGTGIQVFKLHKAGFHVTGVDFSPRTITHLNKEYPEMKFTLGDVRDLPLESDSFDAYWSFGVIEHFYHGYDEILSEMERVIKPGGYLFLAFPHMSRSRTKKAKRGVYPIWQPGEQGDNGFFQFALDENKVARQVKERGFEFLEQKRLSGQSGILDEGGFWVPLVHFLYYKLPGFLKPLRTIVNLVLTPYYSNSILLVFQKKQK